MEPLVRHVKETASYELLVDGEQVGRLDYARRDGLLDFQHTEVDPQRRGQGLAGRLVAAALDDARAQGCRVRPSCPYVEAFMTDHPDYADLRA